MPERTTILLPRSIPGNNEAAVEVCVGHLSFALNDITADECGITNVQTKAVPPFILPTYTEKRDL